MPARKRTPDRIDYASCAYKRCTWVMGELAILNVPRDVLSRMQRLAAKGDGEAQRWFQVDLWNEPVALPSILLQSLSYFSAQR